METASEKIGNYQRNRANSDMKILYESIKFIQNLLGTIQNYTKLHVTFNKGLKHEIWTAKLKDLRLSFKKCFTFWKQKFLKRGSEETRFSKNHVK